MDGMTKSCEQELAAGMVWQGVLEANTSLGGRNIRSMPRYPHGMIGGRMKCHGLTLVGSVSSGIME